MKKKIIVLVIAVIMTMSTVVLFGCMSGRHEIYMKGYFQYIIVGEHSRFPNNRNKAVVAIVGLTGSGQQQEVIDFPREIDGKEVWHIGFGMTSWYGGGYYQLESANLKKVYIHDNITDVYREAFYYWFKQEKTLDVMLCAAINYSLGDGVSGGYSGGYQRIYTYKSIYDTLDENTSVWLRDVQRYALTKNQTLPANVAFLNNYSDEVNGGYYRLDNIESGEKIPAVPNPEREGYSFIGWYTEPECINAWDLDVSPTIEADTEFRLYAGWQAK